MNSNMEERAKMFQSKVEWEGGHFQGDIDMKDGEIPEISKFNAVCSRDKLWTDATLYYYINEKHYDMDQISQIESAAQEIQRKTGCIYLFRVNADSKENYVVIEPSGECSSHIGMMGGPQRLSVNRQCIFNHVTIIHEFMHALGFHHEVARGDRNDYIKIHWDNIDEENWTAFSKVDETLLTPYDYKSIMHYSSNAFAKDPSKVTITALDRNATIGQREKLSPMDVERLQILYGGLEPAKSKCFKEFNIENLFKPANWLHKTKDQKRQQRTDESQQQKVG